MAISLNSLNSTVSNHTTRITNLENKSYKLSPTKLWTGNSKTASSSTFSNYNIFAIKTTYRNYSFIMIRGFSGFGLADDIGGATYFTSYAVISGTTITLTVSGNWISPNIAEIWGIG